MKDRAISKMNEIISYIEKMDDYVKYQNIKDSIKNNKEIMAMIDNVKKLQKKIVNDEYLGKSTELFQKEIDTTIDKLKSYPIYQEMEYLREDLDNMFQSVKSTIEGYFDSKLN